MWNKIFFDDMDYVLRDAAKLMGVHEETVMRRFRKHELFKGHTATDRAPGSVLNAIHKAIKDFPEGPGVTVTEPTTWSLKLGPVAKTVAPRQTCPDTCSFKGKGGCYPENDNTRRHWDRLTHQARDMTDEQIAQAEADGIDKLLANKDLRLHIAGDCKTEAAVKILAAAARRYITRGKERMEGWVEKGKSGHRPKKPRREPRVWTYTHSWRFIPRHVWGPISVLASCETVEDVFHAALAGYASAIVVPEFESHRAYDLKDGSLRAKIVPCPAQTWPGAVNCMSCRLCFNDKKLMDRDVTIAFAVHGGGRMRAAETLKRVSLPMV